MRAREYQTWMRQHNALFSDKTKAQVGDLAFWGTPAVHIGIVTKVTHPKPNKLNIFVTGATTTLGVREIRLGPADSVSTLLGLRPTAAGERSRPHADATRRPTPTPRLPNADS